MEVNRVSFTGRLAQTKKGNTYEKTNTGKQIGTITGLVGGTIAAATPLGRLVALTQAIKICPKHITAGYMGILGGFIVASTLLLRGIGAIPDMLINNSRKAKADNKTADTKPAVNA